jgi:hypothetical protein
MVDICIVGGQGDGYIVVEIYGRQPVGLFENVQPKDEKDILMHSIVLDPAVQTDVKLNMAC